MVHFSVKMILTTLTTGSVDPDIKLERINEIIIKKMMMEII